MKYPAIVSLDKVLPDTGGLESCPGETRKDLATYLSLADSPNSSQMLTLG